MPEFPHAMLREIYEQPQALQRTMELYLSRQSLKPEVAAQLAAWPNAAGEVLIAASGSSRHSGLYGEILLEDLCGLAVDVEYASEYSCRGGIDLRRPSVLVLSQSGETSDTLAALEEAHRLGHRTLAITNHAESTMATEADLSMPLAAGVEKAIPATKSFTCQLIALYLLALHEAQQLGTLDGAEISRRICELRALPAHIERQLAGWRTQTAALAAQLRDAESFLYLGRGVHYAIAREGALKMKESSYVQAEGYPAGELKHGPNALVSDKVPLVVLATVDSSSADSRERYAKTLHLLGEMKAQGARILCVANADDRAAEALATACIFVEPASEHLLAVEEVIPLQLFSYAMAVAHGVDVDHPRHLSKAVIEK